MNNSTRALAILLVGCGHSDAPPQQRRPPEDAPRTETLRPPVPMDAPQPLIIQNIEPGDPPASMVVVTSQPKFYIDRTEVTVGDYRECVAATACTPPLVDHKTWAAKRPITMVKPEQAWDYCAYRGKRLPTNTEWMRAALGEDGRKFPWGNAAPSCNFAVLSKCTRNVPNVGRDVANVGSTPMGASPYGALDMAGNVGEFVNRDTSGQRERFDPIAVGGSIRTTADELHEYFEGKGRSYVAMIDEVTGIRCALTPKR